MKNLKLNPIRELFIKHQAFFDARLRAHPRFKLNNGRNANIALDYLETNRSLKDVGEEYGIGHERVRKIVVYAERTIRDIYERNKKELYLDVYEKLPKEQRAWHRRSQPMPNREKTQQTTREVRVREIIGYLKEDHKKISHQLNLLDNRIDLLEQEVGLGEQIPLRKEQQRREESLPQLVKDGEHTGYYLEDIENYLGKDTFEEDFLPWFANKVGGMFERRYYVLKKDFEEFISMKHYEIT